MATSIDLLITNQQQRVNNAINAVNGTVEQLVEQIASMSFSFVNLDLKTSFPPFVSTATVPNYVKPTVAAPGAAELLSPTFEGIDAVTIPTVAPELNVDGLFDIDRPSAIATFDIEAPTLQVSELVDEISSIAVPLLSNIPFPSITAVTMADYTYTAPTFEGDTDLGSLANPGDYAATYASTYASSKTATESFIDLRLNDWITLNSPGFYDLRDGIEAKLQAALTDGLIPDAYLTSNESAIFARAQGRIEADASQAIATITDGFSRGNFLSITGAELSAITSVLNTKATNLATQANEVYVQRRQQDIALYQDALTRVSAYMAELRGLALQYSQQQLALLEFSANYTGELVNRAIVAYEHFVKQGEWKISALNALNAKFAQDLQSEQIKLEAAKLNLIDQKRLVLDQETADIQNASEQVKALELSVRNYEALVNATVQKGEIEKLKTAQYGLQADAYRIYADAAIAAFRVYESAMAGDQTKYEAELKKYDLYQKQIDAANTLIDAQKTKLSAVSDYNQSKLAEQSALTSVYNTALESSVKRYSAQAEVFSSRVNVDMKSYDLIYQGEKIRQELKMEEYKADTQRLVNQWQVSVEGYVAMVKGAFDLAATATQSMGTIVSQATNV